MIVTAVVPVAGLGTRLLPATKSQPKEMLPLGSRPVVQYVVEELGAAGADELIFVTGRGKTAIEDHFDPDPHLIETLRSAGKEDLLARLDFERRGTSLAYVRQPRPLGLGDAVLRAEAVVAGRPFLLALGDCLIAGGSQGALSRRLGEALESGADAAIAVETIDPALSGRYGIAAPANPVTGQAGPPADEVIELAGLVEKPAPSEAPSRLAVAGRYALTAAIFDHLRSTAPGLGGEIQLTDAIASMIAGGARVVAVPLGEGERRLDTGTPGAYAAAFVEVALADPELSGPVRERIAELLAEESRQDPR